MQQDMIVILDLGSHENTMVARAVRELGVYSEIKPHDITAAELKELPNVKGIIINGGENNIIDGLPIDVEAAVYQFGVPVMSVGHTLAKVENLPAWPEHTAMLEVLKKFVFDECHATANWNMKNFINDQIELIKKQVGDKKVLLALSGGVYVDASERFLSKLAGVADPEEKRKIIGAEFIRVFEEEARKLDGIEFLGQGTIYPDVVESGTKTAKSVKSHHNVGGLPEDLQFKLVEPLYQLFKDEVRACGIELGLPHSMVYRQPFPGPGLGVRCLGAITKERLEAVREADAILREEFANAGLDKKVWQYFTVVPDFKSVGVRDNARTFEYPVIIRAINTVDAMTATIEELDWPILHKITNRILAEVKNVNRVCYDLSPKPNATIEWE